MSLSFRQFFYVGKPGLNTLFLKETGNPSHSSTSHSLSLPYHWKEVGTISTQFCLPLIKTSNYLTKFCKKKNKKKIMAAKSSDGGPNLAPFLTKCYDMVDDPSTNQIVSWGQSNHSFIIWDMTEFSRDLLPKYFKHKNFSSFMRQLNIYGFRKADTDRWEFANEGFIKGEKHLLKNIKRRKHLQGSAQKNTKQEEQVACNEVDDYSKLQKEVEILKFDKSSLTQELVKLKERHESSQNKLLRLREQLQGMENSQQQLLSFLVMVIQNPGLLVQLLQPKDNNWRVSESAKITPVPDGVLVRYQPLPETSDQTVKHDISFDKVKDFFMNFDFPSPPLDDSSYLSSELDLAKLEQFLLSSPTRDDSHPDADDDDDNVLASELEKEIRCLTSCIDDTHQDSTSLELLTQKLECLSPGNMVVENA